MIDRNVIIEQMLELIPEGYDKSEGSIIRDMLMTMAIASEELSMNNDDVVKNSMEDTAEGEWLTEIAEEAGVFRQGATSARGKVTFIGDAGTIIPFGTYVKSDVMQYATLYEAVIGSDGEVTTDIIAVTAGSLGNVLPGYINSLSINISGVDGVINREAVTGGADIESDEALRMRLYLRRQNPVYAGNAAQYVEWAQMASNEVGSAKCIPVWDGPGTVKVIFVTDAGTLPEPALISAVDETIRSYMPCVGVSLTVAAPAEKTINISIKTDESVGSEGLEEIKEAIRKYYVQIALVENSVQYSQICAAVLGAGVIKGFDELKLNNAYSNVTLSETEIPVLGTVSVTN